MPQLDVQDLEAVGKIGWFTRLTGAGARVRSAIRGALRDPEIRAIREAAEALERDGAVVFANLGGWPRPPVLLGFIPDVYAVFEDCEVALWFENEHSALEASTLRQDRALTSWADASPLRVYEQIVVAGGRGGRDC
jgi:hypothetical protein